MDSKRWTAAAAAVDLAVSVGCLALIVLAACIVAGYNPAEATWWQAKPVRRSDDPSPTEIAAIDQLRRDISAWEHGHGRD